MPRIRIRKNYDLTQQDILSNSEYESDDEALSNEISGQPKGWWSSAKIIATLSESKIKQAITYHREMAHLLEVELVARRDNNKRSPAETTKLHFIETRTSPRRSLQCSRTKRQRIMGILEELHLRPEQRETLKKDITMILDFYS